MTIDYHRASELLAEKQGLMQCEEAQRLNDSVSKLLEALVGNVPWDWRYNATHWALDVGHVCTEIGYSIAWMRTFAEYWSECDERGRYSSENHVSYYADNAATRISSCRDKIALLAWSYYCPFNPDKKAEVLNFQQVCERLTNPIRFGMQLDGHQAFLGELAKLDNGDFEQAITYRNKKVHRMEPRVTLRAMQASDHPSYMFALATKKDIRKFDAKLAEMYPNDRLRAAVREGCFLDSMLFDHRTPDQLCWHFEDFDRFAHTCWKSLCDATAGLCEILLAREPMLSKDRPSEDF